MAPIKRLFRDVMSYTPLFVRRTITQLIINNMMSFMMPVKDVLKCDNDPDYKAKLLDKYKKKYPKKAKWLEKKINKSLTLYPKLKELDEQGRSDIKSQMEYAFFGYGFYPDEFLFFDLGGKNREIIVFRTFVSETERWTFRFAANDFTNSLFSDKADTYSRFGKYYKRDALVVDSDEVLTQFLEFINKHPRFVYKKVSSSRGDGVALVENVENGEEFFNKIRNDGKALLEECIVQTEEMAAFNASSVNTVRVSTYNTRSGVVAVHGFFRSGRSGNFIDNAAKGGIFAVLDVQNGELTTDGYDEYGSVYECHPDSGVKFKGYKFPDWKEAEEMCKEIAKEMPSVKYISFDLSHTDKGWVIVEINPSGQYLQQTGQSKGFRDEMRALINDMDLVAPYKLRDYRT